jgi:hypothetical protein
VAPLRGWISNGTLEGCEKAPDCRAWVQSGCKPALAGRDPALLSSIEDVAGLADGRTMRFFSYDTDPMGLTGPLGLRVGRIGLRWGHIDIQFWRQGCTEIRSLRWDLYQSWRFGVECPPCSSATFQIPASAKWMTVTSSQDNVNVDWTLTRRSTGNADSSPYWPLHVLCPLVCVSRFV